jgi:hypothetical protein
VLQRLLNSYADQISALAVFCLQIQDFLAGSSHIFRDHAAFFPPTKQHSYTPSKTNERRTREKNSTSSMHLDVNKYS